MAPPVVVREGGPEDVASCLDIGARLPQWFTPRGLRQMAVDLALQHILVALDGTEVVGFASFFANEGSGHVGWMGTAPEIRRRGVGRALVAHLSTALRAAGADCLYVDTLGESAAYEPYLQTLAFYRAVGFAEHARVLQDDPEYPERLTLRLELSPD